MAHGIWKNPLCNVLIAPPSDRPRLQAAKHMNSRDITMAETRVRHDFRKYSDADIAAKNWDNPTGGDSPFWPEIVGNVKWWGGELNFYSLQPRIQYIHNLVENDSGYPTGDLSIVDWADWMVLFGAENTPDPIAKTVLPDGDQRVLSIGLQRITTEKLIQLKTSGGNIWPNGKLPPRPCFKFAFTKYGGPNTPFVDTTECQCTQNCDDTHFTLGQSHIGLLFGDVWQLILPYAHEEHTQAVLLKQFGAKWYKFGEFDVPKRELGADSWQRDWVSIEVYHLGPFLVFRFNESDDDKLWVVSPWDQMTVEGETTYVADGMVNEGEKWKPFFRTPSAPLYVHMANMACIFRVWDLGWLDNGIVSVLLDLPKAEMGDLDENASAVIGTWPLSLSAIEQDGTVPPVNWRQRKTDVAGVDGNFLPWRCWWTGGILDVPSGVEVGQKLAVSCNLVRGDDDHNNETPLLHGYHLEWELEHDGADLPHWGGITDYRFAVNKIKITMTEPLTGGVDTAEVMIDKVALEEGYPGWSADLRLYSPIRIFTGYEEADFTGRPFCFDASNPTEDFVPDPVGPWPVPRTNLRFEGLVRSVSEAKAVGEEKTFIVLQCMDWNALMVQPAGLIDHEFAAFDFLTPAIPVGAAGKPGIGGSEHYAWGVLHKIIGQVYGKDMQRRTRIFRHYDSDGLQPYEYDMTTAHYWREGSGMTSETAIWRPRWGGYLFQWVCEVMEFDCKLYFWRQGIPFIADYWRFIQGGKDIGLEADPPFPAIAPAASPVQLHGIYGPPTYLVEPSDPTYWKTIYQMNRQVVERSNLEDSAQWALNWFVAWAPPAIWAISAAFARWKSDHRATTQEVLAGYAVDFDSLYNPMAANYTGGVKQGIAVISPVFIARMTPKAPVGIAQAVVNALLARFKGRGPYRCVLKLKGQPDMWWGDRIAYHGGHHKVNFDLQFKYLRVLRIMDEMEFTDSGNTYSSKVMLITEPQGLTGPN